MLTRPEHEQPDLGDDGELRDGQFCTKCGKVSILEARYCYYCGNAFNPIDGTTLPTEAVQPKRQIRSFSENRPTFHSPEWYLLSGPPQFYLGGLLADLFLVVIRGVVKLLGPKLTLILTLICVAVACGFLWAIQGHAFLPSGVGAARTPIRSTSIPAIASNNAPSRVPTLTPVSRLLPNEADIGCLAQMDKNQPVLAVNFKQHISNTLISQGVALLSADGSQKLCRLTLPRASEKEGTTFGTILDDHPRWLPDGRLGFNSARISPRRRMADIYTVNTDGSALQRIPFSPESLEVMFYAPVWSPDGRQIAFISSSMNSFYIGDQIQVINTDGSVLRVLEEDMVQALDWSPDSRFVYFRGVKDGKSELSKVNVSDGQVTLITDSIDVGDFAVSPDGASIAITTAIYPALIVINADGTNSRQLLPTYLTSAASPSWIDNRTIVFAVPGSDILQPSAIYTMLSDGSSPKAIYTGPWRLSNPAAHFTWQNSAKS